MVAGGLVAEFAPDFKPYPHVERAYRNSECRTPIIMIQEESDPYQSICYLAKQKGCAVWSITMDSLKNEQNALDYIDVGTQNGDWVYLTSNESASAEVMRKIALCMMTLAPEPKRFPRRELFRLWLVVEKDFDVNNRINPVFPTLLTQNAIVAHSSKIHTHYVNDEVTSKLVVKQPAEPDMFASAQKKHDKRREAGRESDDESDHDDPEAKQTGLWFHRAVDFYDTDAVLTKYEDIFSVVESENVEGIKEIANSGRVDINNVMRGGMTPLMRAVTAQKVKAVKALLQCGADPTVRREADDCPMVFFCLDSVEVVELLVKGGVDLQATRYEGHLLHTHPDTHPDVAAYAKSQIVSS